jgi:hypothetical protein
MSKSVSRPLELEALGRRPAGQPLRLVLSWLHAEMQADVLSGYITLLFVIRGEFLSHLITLTLIFKSEIPAGFYENIVYKIKSSSNT